MEPIEYKPFSGPREFSSVLFAMFRKYWNFEPNMFFFSWLDETPDLKFVCQESTEETVAFQVPPAVERGIQNCKGIDNPNPDNRFRLRDSDWTGWMDGIIYDIMRGVGNSEGPKKQELPGPFYDKLAEGFIAEYHRRILAFRVTECHPNHHTLTIRDHTLFNSEELNPKEYLLRSEILGIASIFWRQMREMVWSVSKRKFKPVFAYKEGPLIATIITFRPGKVRVVQATCNPSDRHITISYNLRALLDLSRSCYDPNVVKEIAKWILCPPDPVQNPTDPTQSLPLRCKEE